MSKSPGKLLKKRRESCGCFSSPFGRQESHKVANLEADKNFGKKSKKDSENSSEASFYTMNDDDTIGWIPGPKFEADTGFKMGESVPCGEPVCGKMSWTHAEHERFNIRTGPDYAKNGHKTSSLSALYEAVGMDVLKGDEVLSNVAPHLMFPSSPAYYDAGCNLPALLIVNAQLPLAMPSLFSSSETDPGWSIVGYFRIRQQTVDWALKRGESPPPAIEVFMRLLQRKYSDRSLSFKAIGMIHDLEKQNLPLMNLLTKYNGKPVLVTKSSQFHFGTVPYPYLEIDYNVRQWSLLARTTLVQLSGKLKHLTCHVGYLVEATENSDLPERMLTVVTVHNVSVENAKTIKFSQHTS